LKQRTVVFNMFSEEWEEGFEDEHFYYMAHCRPEFLVFSGSPYRLVGADDLSVKNSQKSFSWKFDNRIKDTEQMLRICKTLLCEEGVIPDLAYALISSCLKQIYHLVIGTFLLDVPALSKSCRELEEMATRVLPQLRGQIKKDIDAYINWSAADFEDLDEDTLRMKRYIPDMVELERLFEIAKIAFEQKMVVLFNSNEVV